MRTENMSKYKIGDKIMGIATDMLGIRIVSGTIKKIIENEDTDLTRYRVDDDNNRKDSIYEGETTEYDAWKLKQAEVFYEEAKRLEKKAHGLREMAITEIYSQGSK